MTLARAPRQRGQASIELLAALPLVLALGLVALQVLAVGYAKIQAGTAAEAGALALVSGDDPESAARRALPGWSRAGAQVAVEGARVEVSLEPPSPLRVLRRRLEVRAEAAVQGIGG